MRTLALVLTVSAASFAACRSTPASPQVTVTADTWAVVNGQEITRDRIEKAYQRTRDLSQTVSDEEALGAKLSLLGELITQEILLARARELKIEVPSADLDKAYAEARQNMPDEKFQQELTRRGLTADDMREGLRREMITQKLVEQEVGSKVTVTDQEVSDFFNTNRAQFNVPEEGYRLAQIVVTPVRDARIANRTGDDATTPQAAQYKLEMLTNRLKAGTPFSDLAADYSEDDSATRGGEMGFVPLSRLKQAPPQMREAVLDKEPGTINVLSANGAHTIVLVIAHEKAGQRDLSTPGVRESITAALRGRREQVLRAAYLTAAQTDADVVNYLARRIVQDQAKMPALGPVTPGAK